MKCYIRDTDAAIAGMVELTLEQDAIYNRLLDILYNRDGLVPNSDALVARMIRIDVRIYKRIKQQLHSLGKLWVNQDGFLRTPRFDHTLASAKIRSRSAKDQANFRVHLFEKASDFNDATMLPTPIPRRVSKKEHLIKPDLGKRTQLNGHNYRGKPRHGQASKKGRIWFDIGTSEFDAHAADYRSAHYGLEPPLNHNGAGAWFNIRGEK
jgi:hypothetical protein